MMGLEFLRSGQWVARIQWALHPWLFQGRNSLGREGGGSGCPSLQTDQTSPLRSVCFTFLFYFLVSPDAWDLTLLLIIVFEISGKCFKDKGKKKRKGQAEPYTNVSMFAGEHTLLGKRFFGRGLRCHIVELPPVFYDSFFIISPLMRQIKTNPHSFPSVWGLLLAFVSCCFAAVLGFEKSRLAASSLFVAALAEMGCHLGTMATETQQTKAVPGFRGWGVKSSLAPQHCLRSSWAAIYPWSPKAR